MSLGSSSWCLPWSICCCARATASRSPRSANSEPASASLGVNTFRTKFIIYIATAACTGLIGGLIFLQKLRMSPEAGFSINDWTVVVIFMVVIGGIGTLEGPFIGMLVFFLLRELLADYGRLSDLDGRIAIGVMLKAPQGMWGWVAHRYDLQLFPVGRRLTLAHSRIYQISDAAPQAFSRTMPPTCARPALQAN